MCLTPQEKETLGFNTSQLWVTMGGHSSPISPALSFFLSAALVLKGGDPEECRRADGGPDEPGIGNVFESADNRAAFSGSFNGHARGA